MHIKHVCGRDNGYEMLERKEGARQEVSGCRDKNLTLKVLTYKKVRVGFICPNIQESNIIGLQTRRHEMKTMLVDNCEAGSKINKGRLKLRWRGKVNKGMREEGDIKR